MKYEMIIDDTKWEKLSDIELEKDKPYWFKMPIGRIVMGIFYQNDNSSGIAKCFINEDGLNIKTDTFYILRGSLVQPVQEFK